MYVSSQHQLSWLQSCHPSKDSVGAIIWEQAECKKVDMCVLEMSSIILTQASTMLAVVWSSFFKILFKGDWIIKGTFEATT